MLRIPFGGLRWGLSGKESACTAADTGDMGLIPGLGRFLGLGRRKWQPTPVFLSGESHGQRSLEGYSPQCHKESDTAEVTEHTHTNTHTHTHTHNLVATRWVTGL